MKKYCKNHDASAKEVGIHECKTQQNKLWLLQLHCRNVALFSYCLPKEKWKNSDSFENTAT